jgi:FG-GAP-like repeat
LVDLDGDGRTDILSGSWPGEIYFFRRLADGTFAAGTPLKDKTGKVINVGAASTPFAVDWDENGTIDLIVGTVSGDIFFIPNEGKGKELAFGVPQKLTLEIKDAKQQRQTGLVDAAPTVADWDGDGRLDLIVGDGEGQVLWFRNVGVKGKPKLAPAQTLVPKSPVGWGGDGVLGWGLRVKPCVVDWNGDGKLDLLLGDLCGGFSDRPQQTPEEIAEEKKANDKLPELRQKWATAFQQFRAADTAPAEEPAPARAERLVRRDELRGLVQRYRDEITLVQEIQSRYLPMSQSHGYIWLFRRPP